MWFRGVDSFTNATIIEDFITALFLPIYLVVTNYIIAKTYEKTNIVFIVNGLIIMTCIFISTEIHLRNWADGTEHEYADWGTKAILEFVRNIGIGVSLIGLAIVYFRVRNKNKTTMNIGTK